MAVRGGIGKLFEVKESKRAEVAGVNQQKENNKCLQGCKK